VAQFVDWYCRALETGLREDRRRAVA